MTDKEANDTSYYDSDKDKWRFLGEDFTQDEIEAAQPASTAKREWVWLCPFCQCRNYYLASRCKRAGCWTIRAKFRVSKDNEPKKLEWFAVPLISIYAPKVKANEVITL